MNRFEYRHYDEDFYSEVKAMHIDMPSAQYIEEIENALPTYPQDIQDRVHQIFTEEKEDIAIMNGVFRAIRQGDVKRRTHGLNNSSLKAAIKRVAQECGINPSRYIRDPYNNYSIQLGFITYYFLSNEDEDVLNEKKTERSRKARLDVLNTLIKAQRQYFMDNDDTAVKNRFIRDFQRRTGLTLSVAVENGHHITGEQLDVVHRTVVEMDKQYKTMKDRADELFSQYEGGTKWDF